MSSSESDVFGFSEEEAQSVVKIVILKRIKRCYTLMDICTIHRRRYVFLVDTFSATLLTDFYLIFFRKMVKAIGNVLNVSMVSRLKGSARGAWFLY